MKLKLNRWQLAQEYEKSWWASYKGDIEWYKNFSNEIIEKTQKFIKIRENTYILEIGSGPAGGITFLNSKNKYWANFRDKSVQYKTCKGEYLPFDNNKFDLIIIDNVLDDCDNPILVLNEMNRVIKNGGVIFFRQNIYNIWGRCMRSIMEMFLIDKGHPFTFGKKELLTYFKQRHWTIKLAENTGYFQVWISNFNSFTIKNIIQNMLFIIRNRSLFILAKT